MSSCFLFALKTGKCRKPASPCTVCSVLIYYSITDRASRVVYSSRHCCLGQTIWLHSRIAPRCGCVRVRIYAKQTKPAQSRRQRRNNIRAFFAKVDGKSLPNSPRPRTAVQRKAGVEKICDERRSQSAANPANESPGQAAERPCCMTEPPTKKKNDAHTGMYTER